MEFFLQTLEGTPWYVYIIFLYVVFMGLRAMRHRTIPFRKALIVPILLTLWSIASLYSRWDHRFLSIGLWVISVCVGGAIGWWIGRFYRFQIDRKRGTIAVEGNKWTLWLILSFFAVRYCFGYYYATTPYIPPHSVLIDFSVSGILLGVFIGRAIRYCRAYLKH